MTCSEVHNGRRTKPYPGFTLVRAIHGTMPEKIIKPLVTESSTFGGEVELSTILHITKSAPTSSGNHGRGQLNALSESRKERDMQGEGEGGTAGTEKTQPKRKKEKLIWKESCYHGNFMNIKKTC